MNWIIELKKACREEPTEQEYKKLCYAAKEWPTCACGQLCSTLPRDVSGAPRDQILQYHGNLFYQMVGSRWWKSALFHFKEIESRTATLLAEQGKEP